MRYPPNTPLSPEYHELLDMIEKATEPLRGICAVNAGLDVAGAVQRAMPEQREVDKAASRVLDGKLTMAKFRGVLARWYKRQLLELRKAAKEAA